MKNKVLVVDDEVNILSSIRRTLKNQFEIDVAASGEEALELLSTNKYAVIMTDMKMPNMNGVELLQIVKEKAPNTVRMMLTGNADQKTAIDALNVGSIFRFINKPCGKQELIDALNAGVEQHNLIMSEKILLSQTLKSTINVMGEVLTIVNPQVFADTLQIKNYMLKLADQLKLKASWSFEPMIQLSQLGRAMFIDPALLKENAFDNLSPEQRSMFERHPCLAADLIRKIPRMGAIARTILYQDKGFNGRGIPADDVKGEDIPYESRMMKVVIDFLKFKKLGALEKQAYMRLEEQDELYDPEILEGLKEVIYVEICATQKLVNINELKPNMVIQENIKTKNNLLVATEGQEITDPLLKIISHCIENGALDGKVIVSEN